MFILACTRGGRISVSWHIKHLKVMTHQKSNSFTLLWHFNFNSQTSLRSPQRHQKAEGNKVCCTDVYLAFSFLCTWTNSTATHVVSLCVLCVQCAGDSCSSMRNIGSICMRWRLQGTGLNDETSGSTSSWAAMSSVQIVLAFMWLDICRTFFIIQLLCI